MDDLKIAMKEKDKVRKSVVTMLRSAIKQIEVDQRCDLEDDAIVDIIAKQIKQKNNAIEEFQNGGRPDLVEEAQEEIRILKTYLPEQMTEEEVKAIVDKAVADTGASSMKDMGKVMGIVTQATKGRADGKTVSDIVKAALNQ
ncbi:GatB/YqeY domain-containing protein [Fusibacter sp. JL298sf-3]